MMELTIQELLCVNCVHINALLVMFHKIIVLLVAWYLIELCRIQVVFVNKVIMIQVQLCAFNVILLVRHAIFLHKIVLHATLVYREFKLIINAFVV